MLYYNQETGDELIGSQIISGLWEPVGLKAYDEANKSGTLTYNLYKWKHKLRLLDLFWKQWIEWTWVARQQSSSKCQWMECHDNMI